MLPSSSTALHPSLAILLRPGQARPGQASFQQEPGLADMALGISRHSRLRTGPLPAGTEHKLGFKVTKPLIAAVTQLLEPVYIILLDKILYVLD